MSSRMCVLAIAVSLLLGPAALAQDDKNIEPTSYGLTLKPSPEIAFGRIAMIQAETGAEPDRYVVENLTILQPVEVLVLTKSADDDVTVQIAKVIWDQAERESRTKGTGVASFKFRTEGDFKI